VAIDPRPLAAYQDPSFALPLAGRDVLEEAGQDDCEEIVADLQLVAVSQYPARRDNQCRIGLALVLALADLHAVEVCAIETAQILHPGPSPIQLD
jgi:hypothetical protein